MGEGKEETRIQFEDHDGCEYELRGEDGVLGMYGIDGTTVPPDFTLENCRQLAPVLAYFAQHGTLEGYGEQSVSEPKHRRPDSPGAWKVRFEDQPDSAWYLFIWDEEGMLYFRHENQPETMPLNAMNPLIIGYRLGDVLEDVIKDSWPLNGEWGQRGQLPTRRGVWQHDRSDRYTIGNEFKVDRVHDRLAMVFSDRSCLSFDAIGNTARWRYLGPLTEGSAAPTEPAAEPSQPADEAEIVSKQIIHRIAAVRGLANNPNLQVTSNMIHEATLALADLERRFYDQLTSKV